MKDKKIKLAVVGCGRISSKHFDAIKKHSENLELVAVCDVDSERLKLVAEDQKVKKYDNLEELLKNSDAELIVLCTPSGLHAEHACLAAQYGKHVVCEKPMATRWQDGLKMVRAFDKSKTQLFIVKQNRKNPTVMAVKGAIKQGHFGRIYMVHSNVFWTRPQEYYDQDAWRGTWEFDGGALMNQASHYVDLMDWLIGPVESVQAIMGTLERRVEVEDTCVLNLRYRSGAMGSMSVTMLTYPKNLEGSITIIGEKGTVRIGGKALNEILHWEFEDKSKTIADVKKLNYEISTVYGSGHTPYYDNVIKVLQGYDKPDTDGREGLKSLELLIAAYIAARKGKTIHLPLEF